ncbi:MAG: RNA polymerase sigma factor [Puniceicoccaceae bacterium]
MSGDASFQSRMDQIYRSESGKVLASLIRLIGDMDVAEDALHDAFTAAIKTWPQSSIPENPAAWLITTGKFKAIDVLRRRSRRHMLEPELQRRLDEIESANHSFAEQDIQDDRLRLIFTCCHPAIDPDIQIPLTLREVCGLTTEEIASAFLTSRSTMAQRIVRGKKKIQEARIPFSIPSTAELPERLDSVLAVVYLVFNEGYSASAGQCAIRFELCSEAIRLARAILSLLPEPEVMGLLALMLLHESRRSARLDDAGDIVLLEDQDRSRWDQELIAEGRQWVERAMKLGGVGHYTLQAAISCVHADASSAAQTDWNQIVLLYGLLFRLRPTPVVELNQAVAIAMRDGPEAGLTRIDALLQRGQLQDYHLAHSARGELLRRNGRFEQAAQAFELALGLARQEPERRLLQRKLRMVESSSGVKRA